MPPNDPGAYSLTDWIDIHRNAVAALRQDPNDLEARQAAADAVDWIKRITEEANRRDFEGVVGPAQAALMGFGRGATFGLSDLANREAARVAKEYRPGASLLGDIAGSVALPGLALAKAPRIGAALAAGARPGATLLAKLGSAGLAGALGAAEATAHAAGRAEPGHRLEAITQPMDLPFLPDMPPPAFGFVTGAAGTGLANRYMRGQAVKRAAELREMAESRSAQATARIREARAARLERAAIPADEKDLLQLDILRKRAASIPTENAIQKARLAEIEGRIKRAELGQTTKAEMDAIKREIADLQRQVLVPKAAAAPERTDLELEILRQRAAAGGTGGATDEATVREMFRRSGVAEGPVMERAVAEELARRGVPVPADVPTVGPRVQAPAEPPLTAEALAARRGETLTPLGPQGFEVGGVRSTPPAPAGPGFFEQLYPTIPQRTPAEAALAVQRQRGAEAARSAYNYVTGLGGTEEEAIAAARRGAATARAAAEPPSLPRVAAAEAAGVTTPPAAPTVMGVIGELKNLPVTEQTAALLRLVPTEDLATQARLGRMLAGNVREDWLAAFEAELARRGPVSP